jgi:trehalose 6-phosphate phosphatase
VRKHRLSACTDNGLRGARPTDHSRGRAQARSLAMTHSSSPPVGARVIWRGHSVAEAVSHDRPWDVDVIVSKRSFDAVVFDMDGVITDTARTHFAAWKHTFDEFLRTPTDDTDSARRPFDERDYLQYVDGKAREDGVESFLESRDVHLERGRPQDSPEDESVWGLANRKDRAFHRAVAECGVDAFPSSVALVRELQSRGIRTAIISASRNAQEVLVAAGIETLFPVRVDGRDVHRLGLVGKPAPDVFLEAARQLGAAPERVVVVEDAIAGVEAGQIGRA